MVFLILIVLVLVMKEEIKAAIPETKPIFDTVENLGDEIIDRIEELTAGKFDLIYQKWAEITGLDWRLIKAVSITESSENPNAIGDGGNSFGLMQVQNLVGSYYAGAINEDLLDPDKNVEAGSKFLMEMTLKYGIDGGIEAYNLGETKFLAGLHSPIYLAKVKSNYAVG